MPNPKQVEEYYGDMTDFINANSGLDPLSVDQVKAICRMTKKMPRPWKTHETHETANLTSQRRQIDRPAMQCTARSSRTGERCKAYSIRGGNVCRVHGGSSPKVVAAARRRLLAAADPTAARLIGLALDNGHADAIALAASNSVLDRAGLNAKAEVEITAKPYEQIFESMSVEVGSRSEYRRSQGIEDEPEVLPALSGADPLADELDDQDDSRCDVIDVEIDDDLAGTTTLDERESRSAGHSAAQPSWASPEPPEPSPFGPSPEQPPGNALVPFDEAVAQQAQMRRSIVSHRVTRR